MYWQQKSALMGGWSTGNLTGACTTGDEQGAQWRSNKGHGMGPKVENQQPRSTTPAVRARGKTAPLAGLLHRRHCSNRILLNLKFWQNSNLIWVSFNRHLQPINLLKALTKGRQDWPLHNCLMVLKHLSDKRRYLTSINTCITNLYVIHILIEAVPQFYFISEWMKTYVLEIHAKFLVSGLDVQCSIWHPTAAHLLRNTGETLEPSMTAALADKSPPS